MSALSEIYLRAFRKSPQEGIACSLATAALILAEIQLKQANYLYYFSFWNDLVRYFLGK